MQSWQLGSICWGCVHGTCGLNNPWHRTCGRCQAGLEIPVGLPMWSLVGQQDWEKKKIKDLQSVLQTNNIRKLLISGWFWWMVDNVIRDETSYLEILFFGGDLRRWWCHAMPCQETVLDQPNALRVSGVVWVVAKETRLERGAIDWSPSLKLARCLRLSFIKCAHHGQLKANFIPGKR